MGDKLPVGSRFLVTTNVTRFLERPLTRGQTLEVRGDETKPRGGRRGPIPIDGIILFTTDDDVVGISEESFEGLRIEGTVIDIAVPIAALLTLSDEIRRLRTESVKTTTQSS